MTSYRGISKRHEVNLDQNYFTVLCFEMNGLTFFIPPVLFLSLLKTWENQRFCFQGVLVSLSSVSGRMCSRVLYHGSLPPENLRFSDVFKAYRKKPAQWNVLIDQYFHFNPWPKWSSKSMVHFYFCFLPNKFTLEIYELNMIN